MTFDWQTIAVALIILAALFYTGRRTWSRLRAFRASKGVAAPCETGCGSCGDEQKPKVVPNTQRTVFVELSRIKSKR
ncbi:MAG TPA: FeoB-associated Cys-rich membrane protein [Pyrinomonadaceae bacterium]|nr:FeoB-associated Cys-rich membrane protein [Pyrinomonadaceae bacterium]